jgi:hypothetical protein
MLIKRELEILDYIKSGKLFELKFDTYLLGNIELIKRLDSLGYAKTFSYENEGIFSVIITDKGRKILSNN